MRGWTLLPSERLYLIDVANGLSAAESAKLRGKSVHTVNSSLKGVRRVLKARNTYHAITICLMNDVITLDDIREEDPT